LHFLDIKLKTMRRLPLGRWGKSCQVPCPHMPVGIAQRALLSPDC
jgi:hypothetical protein